MVSCIPSVSVCIFRLDDKRSVRERLMAAAECFRTLDASETASSGMETVECNMDTVTLEVGAELSKVESQFQDVDKWQINRTERGKPYFPNQPELHFSISHSGDYWACAMAEQPVGLDLQEHVRRKDETPESSADRYCRMAKRFFHPWEAEYVRQQDSYRRFFQIWSARESYVKYTGQGIDNHFGEFCVLPGRIDLQEARVQKAGVRQAEERQAGVQNVSDDKAVASWYALDAWFQEMKFAGDYTLCVCTQNVASMDVREYQPIID